MNAVWLRTRSDLRRSWRSWVGLGLLVGLIGGGVIAAAAGARRTDNAYARFAVSSKAADFVVYSSGTDPTFAQISDDTLAGLPEVVASAGASYFPVQDVADIALLAPDDDQLGRTMQRPKMLAGRRPAPEAADEAMISFTLADVHHLHVGDTLRLALTASGDDNPPPVPVALRVVGIEASPGEFPPQHGSGINQATASPAFARAHTDDLKRDATVVLRLRRGSGDAAAVQDEIRGLAGDKPVNSYPIADQSVNTERSIHLQALALWLLAALLLLEGLLVIAQLLVRQSRLEAAEHPALRALGMSRTQLWAVSMGRAVLIGGVGAVAAVTVASLLSPLTPVGLARIAEPRPGFALDAVALGVGALATITLVMLAAAWPAWRAAGAGRQPSPRGQGRPSAVAEVLSRTVAPIPVTTGVRLALEPGRGQTSVPVRSTVTGAVIGIVALAAAVTFSASLGHLLSTPRLYGVTWDARVIQTGGDDGIPAVLPVVQQDTDIGDISTGYAGFPITIGRVRADGIAVEPLVGASLQPLAVEGRLPSGPDEVVLGGRTMAALHTHIGNTVGGRVADATADPLPLRVVGRAVFPSLGDAIGLGEGAALTPDGLQRMVPSGGPPPDTVLVRFRPGVDTSGAFAQLEERVAATGRFAVLQPERPVDLVNFGRVQSLPLVLGILLGAFAAATLAHLLVTSIRRRRPDLAVLKVLGLTSAQVRATVAWQATTLAVVAVTLGVPLGVIAGRLVWRLFAEQLGTSAEPAVPLLALGVLGLAALAVANLVAILPARSAARTQPAVALRSE